MGHDNLYLLDTIATYGELLNMKSCGTKRKIDDNNSGALWYKRLGHISKNRVERLVSDGILDYIDFTNFDVCVECVKGPKRKLRNLRNAKDSLCVSSRESDVCQSMYASRYCIHSWDVKQIFEQSMNGSSQKGYGAFKRIKDYMLTNRRSDQLEITGYSDLDFVGFQDRKRSTSGYIYMLADDAVSWRSAKQSLTTSSIMAT
ncbi:unnamed protein product [Vicia faba]|uniref:GAG-pre-integrase domain-containing protein n=1 Tax=Vicia faba TaxID=3906 RepID=A0AAV1AAB9_VICFA|nr:unnamed protein product [Vicia faba]